MLLALCSLPNPFQFFFLISLYFVVFVVMFRLSAQCQMAAGTAFELSPNFKFDF